MLTEEQEKWILHLSDTDTISIFPYDEKSQEIFRTVCEKIEQKMGSQYRVEQHGATAFGISGQDEIDVYISVSAEKFESVVEEMQRTFGVPKSYYSGRRARFGFLERGKRVDVFPINKEMNDWKNLVVFEAFLRENPSALEEYRMLKESGHGKSVREYYRKKIEFMNDILQKVEQK